MLCVLYRLEVAVSISGNTFPLDPIWAQVAPAQMLLFGHESGDEPAFGQSTVSAPSAWVAMPDCCLVAQDISPRPDPWDWQK
jgi:hypothetical protein